ncbi:MAG: hypothetical protein ABII22_06725 [Candidatus Micrarchaeota archaeon]
MQIKTQAKKKKKVEGMGKTDLFFYVGLLGMLTLIFGVFAQPATLLQKSLFLIGASILALVALKDNQKMLLVLQMLITFANILAFLDFGGILKYGLLLGVAIVGIGYLVFIKYYETDRFGWIGTVGLLLLAIGFATDASTQPFYFGILLGSGALLVAAYSFIDYYQTKGKISLIWFVLNIIFAINPLILALTNM